MILVQKHNDTAAFGALYEKYKGPIYSHLFHLLRNDAKAEELAQETFLKVYRAKDNYKPQAAKFSTWLWTIARNLAFDSMRKKSEVLLSNNADGEARTVDTFDSGKQTQEITLIEKADRQNLEDCVGELVDLQKEALSLRVFSELSYDEISGVMKTSVSSVKSLIFRAKKAVIDCIRRKENSEG